MLYLEDIKFYHKFLFYWQKLKLNFQYLMELCFYCVPYIVAQYTNSYHLNLFVRVLQLNRYHYKNLLNRKLVVFVRIFQPILGF